MSIWDERADLDDGGGRTHLARSHRDRVLFGVCGGVGEATGIDPLVIRLGLIVLTVVGVGWTIPAYLLAGFVLRRSSSGGSSARSRRSTKVSAGWTLVVVGAFLALQQLHIVNTTLVAALVMFVVGINLVIRHRH